MGREWAGFSLIFYPPSSGRSDGGWGQGRLDKEALEGKIPPMTMIATADRSRLHIRGLQDGHRYRVSKQGDGWLIQPEPPPKPKLREWAGGKRSLRQVRDEMLALGFQFEPSMNEEVGPCLF